MPVSLTLGRKSVSLPFVYELSGDTLLTRDGQVTLQGAYEVEIRYSFTAAGIGAMTAIGASTAAGIFAANGASSLAAFSAGDLVGTFTANGTSSLSASVSGSVSSAFTASGVSALTVDARIDASAEFTAIGTSSMFGAVEGATEISGFFTSAGTGTMTAIGQIEVQTEPYVEAGYVDTDYVELAA